jgi:hypothetical protein
VAEVPQVTGRAAAQVDTQLEQMEVDQQVDLK